MTCLERCSAFTSPETSSRVARMRVAIVGGTAGLGRGLAVRLSRAGAKVVIGSRQEEKAVIAADHVRSIAGDVTVDGGANSDVVGDADIAVVTVPFPGQADTYKMLKERMSPGRPVIDCTVPLASEIGGKATRVLTVWEGSAAQQAKGILGKDFPVASGFHTVMAGSLEDLDEVVGDVLVCGEREAKQAASELVSMIEGARYVDCGPLENARILESLTALLIGINIRYKLDPGAGLQITRLPD